MGLGPPVCMECELLLEFNNDTKKYHCVMCGHVRSNSDPEPTNLWELTTSEQLRFIKNTEGKKHMFGSKKEEVKAPKWTIDKQFSFCYGHRVWSQKLIGDYCESGDDCCKCRHLHGHEGLVHVFLEGEELERGMVTDFKHLGWLKNFLDDNLDHKFILDMNDPFFPSIANLHVVPGISEENELTFKPTVALNTSDAETLTGKPVYVPGTDFLAGWALDVSDLSGPEEEFYEGFFFVNFVPTSENFSRWLFQCVETKMDAIGIKTARIDWFETPKSRSSYSGG